MKIFFLNSKRCRCRNESRLYSHNPKKVGRYIIQAICSKSFSIITTRKKAENHTKPVSKKSEREKHHQSTLVQPERNNKTHYNKFLFHFSFLYGNFFFSFWNYSVVFPSWNIYALRKLYNFFSPSNCLELHLWEMKGIRAETRRKMNQSIRWTVV